MIGIIRTVIGKFKMKKERENMKKPENRKELEEALRRFFEIDKVLPSVRPSNPKSLIGKMIVIPDTERSIEDINEDCQRRITLTAEDIILWEVANDWLNLIKNKTNKFVVKRRCMGKGWKKISTELCKEGYTQRQLHRVSLWRNFTDGLDEILRNFS